MEIKINNVDYTSSIANGFVIKDELGEELDDITLIVNNIDKTLFRAGYDVEIKSGIENIGNLYFIINSFTESMIDTQEKKYQYTLSCISKMKILEEVFLPNLKITQPHLPKRGSLEAEYYKANYIETALDYARSQFNLMLWPYIKNTNKSLKDITIPEMEWSTPTARQVIDDVLITIPNMPCYASFVSKYTIQAIPLAYFPNKKDISNLNWIENEDYDQLSESADSIVCDTKNVLNSDGVKTPQITYRAGIGELQLVYNENTKIYLQNAKIDKIKSIVVPNVTFRYVTVDRSDPDNPTTTTTTITEDIDITSCLVEKTIHDSKPYLSTLIAGRDDPSIYKNGCIYFENGGNYIGGFFQSAFGVNKTINIIVASIICKKYNLDSGPLGSDRYFEGFGDTPSSPVDYCKNIKFVVEYSNYEDVRVITHKKDSIDYKGAMLVGQKQSVVNYEALVRYHSEVSNRIGNPMKKVVGYLKYSELPNLGDYIGDYVLISREMALYDDIVVFKGILSKNYVAQTLFTGINARTRFTQLLSSEESIVREEIFEHTIGVLDTAGENTYSRYIKNLVDSLITDNFNKKVNKCNAIQCDMGNTYIDKSGNTKEYKKFYLLANVFYGPNKVTVTGQCYDNFTVGMQLYQEGGATYQKYLQYTNDFGTTDDIHSRLISELSVIDNNNFPEVSTSDRYEEAYEDASKHYYLFKKDNGETLRVTHQFNFVSKSERLVLGDIFSKYFPLCGVKRELYIYAEKDSSNMPDKKYPTIDSSHTKKSWKIYKSSTNSTIKIDTLAENMNDYWWYAITDTDNNVLLYLYKNESSQSLSDVISFSYKFDY